MPLHYAIIFIIDINRTGVYLEKFLTLYKGCDLINESFKHRKQCMGVGQEDLYYGYS
jgi:hypothetical protein